MARILMVLALMFIAIATSIAEASHTDHELSSTSRTMSRFATYNPRALVTCNKFPRICRAKGSPGPDCCNKRCVDVKSDGVNCGECGKRCRYGEACCGGKCVDVMFDHKNCGGCKRRCNKGSLCKYGMCSYA